MPPEQSLVVADERVATGRGSRATILTLVVSEHERGLCHIHGTLDRSNPQQRLPLRVGAIFGAEYPLPQILGFIRKQT